MFEGFERRRVTTSGAEINLVTAGSGPPLLLLHGYPQTLAVWHRVAPALRADYTVVAPDLRGYGESSTPEPGDDHSGYSFRSMAADQIEVMSALGQRTFTVVGHDRGARVAHRMALDHPTSVERAMLLDIVPTRHVLRSVDARLALRYYHWFFLAQPEIPDRLVGADPMYYLHASLGSLGSGLGVHAPEAMASYEQAFADPARRRAMFEDYRAATTIDSVHDEQDAGRRLQLPLLVLWGAAGVVGELYDPLAVWREYADKVEGHSLPAGHFVVDEQPQLIIDEIRAFTPR